MRYRTKFAFFIATCFPSMQGLPSRADTLFLENHQCTFGNFQSVSMNGNFLPSELPYVRVLDAELKSGCASIIKICYNNSYNSLPAGVRQVFDRQIVIHNTCQHRVFAFLQRRDFSSAAALTRSSNKITKSLADLLTYGEIRSEIVENNKKGAEQILSATGPLLGVPGKIGKVFEATKGALEFGELYKDIQSDASVDIAIKEPGFEKISEAVAEHFAEKADEAFSARMAEIAQMGGCQ